jgi:hypothetical protein
VNSWNSWRNSGDSFHCACGEEKAFHGEATLQLQHEKSTMSIDRYRLQVANCFKWLKQQWTLLRAMVRRSLSFLMEASSLNLGRPECLRASETTQPASEQHRLFLGQWLQRFG